VANEGKVMAVVSEGDAEGALASMRSHPLGSNAARIGRFTDDDPGLCVLMTEAGGSRMVSKPYGEELPRIC
jgi:hydrogenase expression/formation protein HypE